MSTIKADNIATLAGVSTSMANAVNGSAKAWVNFNGTGTVAIRGQYNVSSLTDNGTGNYTVNFTNAMSDADYAVSVSMGILGSPSSSQMNSNNTAKTTSTFQVRFLNNTSAYDYNSCDVAIFR